MLENVLVLPFFFRPSSISLYEYTTFYLSFFPFQGHLSCFHFLAIMNNDNKNICIQVMCEYLFSLLWDIHLLVGSLCFMEALRVTF